MVSVKTVKRGRQNSLFILTKKGYILFIEAVALGDV
jgi:hypothetical protein